MSPRPGLASLIAALLLWSAAGPLMMSARPRAASGECCSAQRGGMCDDHCGNSCCRGHAHTEASESSAPQSGPATCALRAACGGGEDGVVTIVTLGVYLPGSQAEIAAPTQAS